MKLLKNEDINGQIYVWEFFWELLVWQVLILPMQPKYVQCFFVFELCPSIYMEATCFDDISLAHFPNPNFKQSSL